MQGGLSSPPFSFVECGRLVRTRPSPGAGGLENPPHIKAYNVAVRA